MNLKIKALKDGLTKPQVQTKGSAGIDFFVDSVELKGEEIVICNTGICVEVPPGFFMMLVPRSSLYKQGYTLANSVGIIDSDYRGQVKIILRSFPGHDSAGSLCGTRVVQGIILSHEVITSIITVTDLSETERGSGGFGSTGKQ
jgi:dUTP pyrophosphatase